MGIDISGNQRQFWVLSHVDQFTGNTSYSLLRDRKKNENLRYIDAFAIKSIQY